MADAPEITLNELEEVLRSIGNAGSEPVSPHVNPARADDEDSIYCIKNGAYVRISEDRMSAWIYLNPPKPGEGFSFIQYRSHSQEACIRAGNTHRPRNGACERDRRLL